MAGSYVVTLYKERVLEANRQKGLPKEHWDTFDEKPFERYTRMLGLLSLLNQMIDTFGLHEYKELIFKSELARQQAKGIPKK